MVVVNLLPRDIPTYISLSLPLDKNEKKRIFYKVTHISLNRGDTKMREICTQRKRMLFVYSMKLSLWGLWKKAMRGYNWIDIMVNNDNIDDGESHL